MDFATIEQAAMDLQNQIWAQKHVIWPTGSYPHIEQMFSPEIAARVLGIGYDLHPRLHLINGEEVAGMIDRQANKIAVAQRFGPQVMRFTGAHEIGHWVLHPNQVMHRDLPGSIEGRDLPPQEREANYFAGFLLVPTDLLQKAVSLRFKLNRDGAVILNDTTAAYFGETDGDAFEAMPRFERALMVANKNGRYPKLTELFNVSSKAMARRLIEVRAVF